MKNATLHYRIGTYINIGIPREFITAATLASVFAVVSSKGDVLVHETDWDASDDGAVLWFVIDLEFTGVNQDWLVKELRNTYELTVEGTYHDA
jgi:hypothetical protein